MATLPVDDKYYTMFLKGLGISSVAELDKLPKDVSYMFEVVGPSNKIILDYKETKVYSLNAVVTSSGERVINLEEIFEFAGLSPLYPKLVYSAGTFSLDDVISHFKTTDASKNRIEGFIAYSQEGEPLIKLKTDLYMKLTHLKPVFRTPQFFAFEIFKSGVSPAVDHDQEVIDAYDAIVTEFEDFRDGVVSGYQQGEAQDGAQDGLVAQTQDGLIAQTVAKLTIAGLFDVFVESKSWKPHAPPE